MTFKKLDIQIKALIEGVIKKNTMQEVADLAKSLVVNRTNRGFGVKTPEGKAERLKALSASYKRKRRRLKASGELSAQTTPAKSNLTKTRQMLDSVDARASTAKAEVFLKNERAKEKAELQANEGREFMNLSKNEVKKVKKLIEDKIINDIKKKGL